MKSFKGVFLMTLVSFALWMVLNGSLAIPVIGAGLLVSISVSLLFCTRCSVFSEVRLSPKAIVYGIIYFFVFFKELIFANLDVAKRTLSPSLPINPGIVEVKTKLKSKIGRLALANSITLTPGTLTVDITGDTLYIHWIDVTSSDIESATKEIVTTFEKYLEVIYG